MLQAVAVAVLLLGVIVGLWAVTRSLQRLGSMVAWWMSLNKPERSNLPADWALVEIGDEIMVSYSGGEMDYPEPMRVDAVYGDGTIRVGPVEEQAA